MAGLDRKFTPRSLKHLAFSALAALRPKAFRDHFQELRWRAYERFALQGPSPRYRKVYKFPGLQAAERYQRRNMHEQQKRCHKNGCAVSPHLFTETTDQSGPSADPLAPERQTYPQAPAAPAHPSNQKEQNNG